MTKPRLWLHVSHGTYYAIYKEGERWRQKSLKTKDLGVARIKFNDFLDTLMAGKIKPITLTRGKITLFAFCDEFLADVSVRCEPSTYTLYDVALRKAKACWGDINISRLGERHFSQLLAQMSKDGLLAPTINKNYRHIKAAVRKGLSWYKIPDTIQYPKPLKEKSVLRCLTSQELVKLIGTIDDQEFADFCLISAYTGLRSGEIMRLRDEDIDRLAPGMLRITPEQKNKTESYIPYSKSAGAILGRYRGQGGRLFRFRTVDWISKKYKFYARKAGIGWSRFHDLRHTFGSHLALEGEREASIQGLMRHKSIISTQIYTRLAPEHLREASEKLNYGPMPVGKKKG